LHFLKSFFFFIFFSLIGFSSDGLSSTSFLTDGNKAVLEPVSRVTISSSYSGLLEYSKGDGIRFKKGDVLFENRSELLKMEADILKRKIKSLGLEVKYYTVVQNDTLRNFKKNIMTEAEVKESKHEVLRLVNKVDVFQAELDLVNYKILLLSQKAPFSGVVSVSYKKQNEYARIGDNILEIINDHQLLAVCGIAVARLDNLKLNSTASIVVKGKTYPAKIYYIAPEVDASVGIVTVKVIIDNKDGKLRPGMGCKVTLND
jgi:hypothetical protein